jgi:WD40 repeat protein
MSNLKNINKTHNSYSFIYEQRLYNLKLSMVNEYINIKLNEDHSIFSYAGNVNLNEMKKERLFADCETLQDLKDTIEYIINEGNVFLETNKINSYKLRLFDKIVNKYVSTEISLIEEELPKNINILHKIDDQLKSLFTMLKDKDNSISDSIKINNEEIKALKDKIVTSNRKDYISDLQVRTSKEGVFKATETFDNFILNPNSIDSLVKKMRLYKDVTSNLDDAGIGGWLRDRYSDLYNEVSKVLISCSMTRSSQEREEREDNQTIKVLKGEIEGIQRSLKNLTQHNNLTLPRETSELYSYCNKLVKDIDEGNNAMKENERSLEEKLKAINTGEIIYKEKVGIYFLLLLHNGHIAIASHDGTIKIWDIRKNAYIKILEGHSNAVRRLVLMSDGNIASGSDDKLIKIWDCRNDYACIRTLSGHEGTIKSLLELTNKNLISGSEDKTIRIWDYKEFKNIRIIENDFPIPTLINLPGCFFASGGGKNITIWDTTCRCINTIEEKLIVIRILLLPDNNIVSGTSRDIKIYKCNYGYKEIHCIMIMSEHTQAISSLCLLNDQYLVSGSFDKTIKLWDINNNFKCINTLKGHENSIFSVTQLRDDSLISSSFDGTIRLWK